MRCRVSHLGHWHRTIPFSYACRENSWDERSPQSGTVQVNVMLRRRSILPMGCPLDVETPGACSSSSEAADEKGSSSRCGWDCSPDEGDGGVEAGDDVSDGLGDAAGDEGVEEELSGEEDVKEALEEDASLAEQDLQVVCAEKGCVAFGLDSALLLAARPADTPDCRWVGVYAEYGRNAAVRFHAPLLARAADDAGSFSSETSPVRQGRAQRSAEEADMSDRE